ncbi:MAG: hypothetical protein QM648_09090 [Solirubrobacterales bacterium]
MQATSHNPTPTAGFAPVTPIGDQPILSLVPPMAGDAGVRLPDPIAPQLTEQQPLPTSQAIPVAPVRRRRPVTPLIQLPMGGSLAGALQVAPLLPGQHLQQPQIQPTPAAYGLQPTTFPFMSAPAFNLMPQVYGMMPQPLPMQTFVAFVTLMPQQPQFGYAPGPMAWPAPQPPLGYPGYGY